MTLKSEIFSVYLGHARAHDKVLMDIQDLQKTEAITLTSTAQLRAPPNLVSNISVAKQSVVYI